MKQPAVKSHDRVSRAGVLGGKLTKAADISQERGGKPLEAGKGEERDSLRARRRSTAQLTPQSRPSDTHFRLLTSALQDKFVF